MAAFHTLHGAHQGLRVLARDRTGRSTAGIAPLTLVPIVPQIPLLAALGCGAEAQAVRALDTGATRSQGCSKGPMQGADLRCWWACWGMGE